ncbi:MAG TPA: AbgT family transporter [Clostridia bacterium]|nr:AbgT family transporter [Clostridia bacterium]
MKKIKFSVPHTIVILMILVLIVTALTYIVPAGSYDRVKNTATGRTVVDAASFKYVDPSPVSPLKMFQCIPKGFQQASSIIFFLLIIGGSFEIINRTRMTEAGIARVIKKLEKRKMLLFPALITLFALGASTFGMAEETIIFIPIIASICVALGYDVMLAAAICFCGVRVGTMCGMMNPFTIGVAQGISELPLYSGLGFRTIMLIIGIIITSAYVMWYAGRIKKNPEKSIMYGVNAEGSIETQIDFDNIPEYTKRHNLILLIVIIGFTAMIFGVIKLKWYIDEIAAVFLATGIIAGFVGGFKPNDMAKYFISGAQQLVLAALVVGTARSVLVVMTEGQIIDTIINYTVNGLQNLPTLAAANGMYVIQSFLNLLIPSGSGQAATSMPIMVPIADMMGINRQVAVLAYHLGDGVTNLINPGDGALMASLSIVGIPFEKWLKWVIPLAVIWTIFGFITVSIGHLMQFGPF